MSETLTPARPDTGTADQPAPRWRNLWFLSAPPDTIWGPDTYASQDEAERNWRERKAELAAWLDLYGDGFCQDPYGWLRVSRLQFAIPLPDPEAT